MLVGKGKRRDISIAAALAGDLGNRGIRFSLFHLRALSRRDADAVEQGVMFLCTC